MERYTAAERVDKMFNGEGQPLLGPNYRWHTQDGRPLHDIAMELGATVEPHPHEGYRYIFPDESAIVVCRGAWDIEGSDPWSWRCLEEMARD